MALTESLMAVPHPLPDALVELVAERFRVIGEPMRIKLLDQLRVGGASVGDLAAAIGGSQQNASRHLNVLHAAGIVARRRDGTRVVYSIADQSVFELCEITCGSLHGAVTELAAMLEPSTQTKGSPQ